MSVSASSLPPWHNEHSRYEYAAWREFLLSASPETIRELVERAVLPMDVLVCVMRSLLDDSSNQRVRDKAVGVLIYVILGSDLVPAKVWGPLGVLDDLWLLLGLLNDIFNESNQDDLLRWWPGNEADLKRVAKWLKVSQKLPKNLFQKSLGLVDGFRDQLVSLGKKFR